MRPLLRDHLGDRFVDRLAVGRSVRRVIEPRRRVGSVAAKLRVADRGVRAGTVGGAGPVGDGVLQRFDVPTGKQVKVGLQTGKR